MKSIPLFLASLFCLSFIHAQNAKKVKGNGNVVTVERNTREYDGIRVGGFFEVELVSGKEGNIALTGEDNILEHIESYVESGTLVIKKPDNLILKTSSGNTVFITIPVENIDAIRLSGSGKLYSQMVLKGEDLRIRTSGSRNLELSVNTQSLTAVSSGSSSISLNGNTENFEATSSGSSHVRAYEMKANSVALRASGSSNIWAMANESLISRVSGSANIRYKGDPEKIISNTSGSGKVSKKS
ncbi:MAG: head GIN domain-containing protein [Bacteroidota bacterium]